MKDNQKSIDLDFLRKILSIHKNQFNKENEISNNKKENSYSHLITQLITNYHLVESLKSGKFRSESYYDEVLSGEEFSNLITGKNIKHLLFSDESLDYKRFYTEEYCKLFYLMGGVDGKLSKEALTRSILIVSKFFNNMNEFLNEEIGNTDKLRNNDGLVVKMSEEVDEIIKYLSTDSDNFLSVKDFINTMTMNTGGFPYDEFKIFSNYY